MKKPWSGRFREATRKSVENFTESLSFDHRLYPYDIWGSIAHARMLGDVGLISKTEADKIITGLKAVEQNIKDSKPDFDPAFEDIHMLVEHMLVKDKRAR